MEPTSNALFESLLMQHRIVVERYINYRLPSAYDANDVIQETYLAAFRYFSELRNKDLFKQWILTIAKNQCNRWYRQNASNYCVSIDSIREIADERQPIYDDTVSCVLSRLSKTSVDLLVGYYLEGFSQRELSQRLGVPVGTVKSRLYYAKKQFRTLCPPEVILSYERGRRNMQKKNYTNGFSMELPSLTITPKEVPFFEVKFEEESFIIPRVGNKNSEGSYRYPDGQLALVSTCYVPKKAFIHEVEGVEIHRDTYNVKANRMYKNEAVWFAQLTDEYLRDLATI